MSNSGTIGFFDSGVGGLTIWNEVNKLLPLENTIYLADSINAPYGEKNQEEILKLCIQNVDFLIERNAKMIVVACNTATTQAIDKLRDLYAIPFIGIEPAIKPAALKSKTKCIGVLATNGTIESVHFNRTKEHFSNDVKVVTQVGEGLVRAIEGGLLNSLELNGILKEHLEILCKEPIDHLVLGCTHYPLLIPMIEKNIEGNISIVDPGPSVAKQTERVINANYLTNSDPELPAHKMYSTGRIDVLKSIVESFSLSTANQVSYSSLYQPE